jgi:4-hydroxybenzoate polyprenyltransferase
VELTIKDGNDPVSWLNAFVQTLRPYQWTKNTVVFAALIFSRQVFVLSDLARSTVTFLLFCFVAGWVYTVNDIRDLESDRQHPVKRQRPLASGAISPVSALVVSTLLMTLSVLGSLWLDVTVTVVLVLYAVSNYLYSTWLKNVVVLDILIIALGFVFRAVAGGFAIDVPISHWLLVCTFFLALFLVVGKRRNELVTLKEEAVNHRRILNEYTETFLDQMISVVTGATILGYALYTVDQETVTKFGTDHLIYTIPFVVYGIFRYFYLIYKKKLGGAPEKILAKDRHIQITVALWLAVAAAVIYWGW